MLYTAIPNTTLTPSALCMGSTMIGSVIDKELSFRMLDAFLDAGGTFVDTAKVYADWLPGPRSATMPTMPAASAAPTPTISPASSSVTISPSRSRRGSPGPRASGARRRPICFRARHRTRPRRRLRSRTPASCRRRPASGTPRSSITSSPWASSPSDGSRRTFATTS